MAYSFILPSISPTANGDGSLIGSVNETDFTASFNDKHISDVVYVYRKNVAGQSFSFDDISTAAGNDTTSDFLPFGTNAQMSAGDELYISCDHNQEELFFKIDTPGVWTGTLDIKYSSNGTTANATLQGVVDNSNGFRNSAGVYRISFTKPTDIQAFSPVPGDILSKKWFVFKPTITAVTTAPILSRVWIHHDQHLLTDVTTAANDVSVPSSTPETFFPTVDSAHYFSFANPAMGLVRNVHQASANVRTRQLEYYANDNIWKPLQNISDPSNDYKAGSLTYSATPVQYIVGWSVPTDWSSKTLEFNTSSGTVNSTGYWIRNRTASVQAYGPAQSTKYTIRAKQFGNSNTSGYQVPVATTLRMITIDEPLSMSGSGAVTLQISNLSTGASATATIPASPTWPLNLDVADLSLAADNRFGLFYNSGTRTFTSAPLTLHT